MKKLKGSTRVCCCGFGVAVAAFNLGLSNEQSRKIRGALADSADGSLIERDGLMREARRGCWITPGKSNGGAGGGDLGEDVVLGRISPAQPEFEIVKQRRRFCELMLVGVHLGAQELGVVGEDIVMEGLSPDAGELQVSRGVVSPTELMEKRRIVK